MKKISELKIALAHDFLTVDGGAEKVLWKLHELFPKAPVYTALYFPERLKKKFEELDIRESFVGKLPLKRLFMHQYKLFYHMGFEDFDFTEYDVVISSTYAGYSKGLITGPDTLHVSYVHNVPRYLWHLPTALHGTLHPIWEKIVLPPLEHYWRMWDRMSAQRPDHLICNSKVVKQRVKKYWGRDSEVVYPPVEIERFQDKPVRKGKYWIHFGRIEQYKNIDVAIKACVKNKQKLIIAGTGDYENELKRLVTELKGERYIEFTGWIEDSDLEDLISNSKGFVFPGMSEDFGIVLVEANAAGKPVIAFESLGSKDIIKDGETGILVKTFGVDQMAKALKRAWEMNFDPEKCRKNALRFGPEKFEEGIKKNVSKWLTE